MSKLNWSIWQENVVQDRQCLKAVFSAYSILSKLYLKIVECEFP